MLEMTAGAAVRIRRMRSRAEELGGVDCRVLRVAPSGARDEVAVRIAFVPVPHDGDQVGESHGIPWCIDGSVAELLDEMVLDCHPDDSTGLFIRARSAAATELRSPQP